MDPSYNLALKSKLVRKMTGKNNYVKDGVKDVYKGYRYLFNTKDAGVDKNAIVPSFETWGTKNDEVFSEEDFTNTILER